MFLNKVVYYLRIVLKVNRRGNLDFLNFYRGLGKVGEGFSEYLGYDCLVILLFFLGEGKKVLIFLV